jgi:hypothetical protein
MTLGQFLDKAKDFPREAILVTPGSDHSYRLAEADSTTALQEGRNEYTEDFGEEDTPEAEYSKRVPVIVFS